MISVYDFFSSKEPKHVYYINENITINGKKFYINKQIGGGGESFVFEIYEDIEDIEEAKNFALKVCKRSNKVVKTKIIPNNRFLDEISIANIFSEQKYKNNFITCFLDGDIDMLNTKKKKPTNHLCYVMDKAEESLEEYLCASFEWDHEIEIFPQIRELANSLKLLHEQNYVHRDIKPQNILVDGKTFKLADFGMVEQENTSCTKNGPKYWPTPELLNMCDDTVHCSGKQTDVFMLGCIFYFIYTMKYPVGNININLIHDDYKMKPIIEKMISYKIEDRHKNGEEVYADISQIRFD